MGNNRARRAKDPGGTVLLAQTATFDELGRLMTFVGAAARPGLSATTGPTTQRRSPIRVPTFTTGSSTP